VNGLKRPGDGVAAAAFERNDELALFRYRVNLGARHLANGAGNRIDLREPCMHDETDDVNLPGLGTLLCVRIRHIRHICTEASEMPCFAGPHALLSYPRVLLRGVVKLQYRREFMAAF